MGTRIPGLAIPRGRRRPLCVLAQALPAAGLRPHRRTWTRPAIIDALRHWERAHGRAPYHDEWRAAAPDHPPVGTVKLVCGSWSAALRAAGLQPALHAPWTEADVLEGLLRFERDHERPPTSADPRDTRGTPYPPGSAVQRTFGSLGEALQRLGHRTTSPAPAPTGKFSTRYAHTPARTPGHPLSRYGEPSAAAPARRSSSVATAAGTPPSSPPLSPTRRPRH